MEKVLFFVEYLLLVKSNTKIYLKPPDYSDNAEGVNNETRLGQLGANISPDRSSLTPQVLIGNF